MAIDKNFGNVNASELSTGGPNQTKITATLPNALKEGKPIADDGKLYPTIQEAENAANSWVFVPPGNYKESVNIDTDGLKLIGAGKNTTINGETSPALVLSNSNIAIASLSVETNSDGGMGNGDANAIETGTGADSTTIKNILIKQADEKGIKLDHGNNHQISSVITESTDGSAIIINVNGVNVKNCIIKGCGWTGIDSNTSDEIIVSNCIIYDSADDGIVVDDDSVVTGCRVHSAGEDGLQANGSDAIFANCRVSDSAENDFREFGSGTLTDGNFTGSAN